MRRLLDRLEAIWLRELAVVDARGMAGAEQGVRAPSTAEWLSARLGVSADTANSWVRAARALPWRPDRDGRGPGHGICRQACRSTGLWHQDLHVGGMTASASGTVEQLLAAKAASAGRRLIYVNPQYTSVTCHACGARCTRPRQTPSSVLFTAQRS